MSTEPPDDPTKPNGDGFVIPPEIDSGPPPKPLEWLADVAPSQAGWIVKGILPDTGIAMIVGASSSGKSFLTLDWGLRIACGMDVLGARTRRVGVAYIAAEAPGAVRKRIVGWRDKHGDDGAFALYTQQLNLFAANDVGRVIDTLRSAHVEFRELGEPLGLIVIDTMAAATAGGEENSSADMGAAISSIQHIGHELDVLPLVIHHLGKDSSRGARGHSSLFAAVDTAIELTYDEDTGIRSFKLAKQRDDAAGQAWSFKLRQVELGTDSDGDPITSCIVDYIDTPSAAAKRGRGGEQEIVFNAIRGALSTHGEKAPHGVPAPPGVYVAPYSVVRERALDAGLCDSGETASFKRKAFFKAVQALKKSGRIDVFRPGDDGCFWLL